MIAVDSSPKYYRNHDVVQLLRAINSAVPDFPRPTSACVYLGSWALEWAYDSCTLVIDVAIKMGTVHWFLSQVTPREQRRMPNVVLISLWQTVPDVSFKGVNVDTLLPHLDFIAAASVQDA